MGEAIEGEIVVTTELEAAELGSVNRGGRPSDMTVDVVTKLIAAFNNAYNIGEACGYAGISRMTYYRWLEKDDEFSYKMSEAQAAPNKKAKEVVLTAINEGDVNTAKWYLDRRDPDFKPKGELAIPDGQQKTEEKLKEFMDDTDDGAYPDAVTADAISAEPTAPTGTEVRGEVAQSPTDIS